MICSYNFARNKSDFIRAIKWDLVVIDEAHRLRNVYKPNNKIARELRAALEHAPKLLLPPLLFRTRCWSSMVWSVLSMSIPLAI
ncbi:MAG: SNF2-related protein [Desulfomonilia bacterium]